MPSQAKKLDKNARSLNENVYTISKKDYNKLNNSEKPTILDETKLIDVKTADPYTIDENYNILHPLTI